MNVNEQMLTARLQDFSAPGEIEAGERGRRIVLAAFAERTPARRRRLRWPRLVWPVLAALLAAGAVAVAGHLRDSSSRDPACRSRRSSSRTASSSPSGAASPTPSTRAVACARSARRPTAISHPTARTPCRIGIGPPRSPRRGWPGALARARAGTGLAAALVARANRAAVLPRRLPGPRRAVRRRRGRPWRSPGGGARTRRRARVAAARGEARARVRRSRRRSHPRHRRPRGRRACAHGGAARAQLARRRARARRHRQLGCDALQRRRQSLQRVPVQGGSALDGGFAPAGNRLVILRRDLSGRTSLLVRGASGPLRPVRHLVLTAVGDLRFSPDGTSALVASREGDEWIDIRLRDGRQTRLRRVGERLRAGLMPRALAWAG